MSPKQWSKNTRADEKATDKDSRGALYRRKCHMHRCFRDSMFDADHQITFFVLTQHSAVR